MNNKYYELNSGRAGISQINLANGQVVHIHEDTNPDLSFLGFNLLHIYNTKFLNDPNNLYGKGWRLSINQTLTKVTDDLNDQRYIYTDDLDFSKYKEVKLMINLSDANLVLELPIMYDDKNELISTSIITQHKVKEEIHYFEATIKEDSIWLDSPIEVGVSLYVK